MTKVNDNEVRMLVLKPREWDKLSDIALSFGCLKDDKPSIALMLKGIADGTLIVSNADTWQNILDKISTY